MKRKSGKIGLVVADDQVRGIQYVDGKVVTASVAVGENLKKDLRKLLSTSSFVGRNVSIGLEGQSVLVESLVLPPGSKPSKSVCNDRLKGDPVFNQERAIMGLAEEIPSTSKGSSLVVMVAMLRERLAEIMAVCRELQLDIETVECAALSSWRAWQSEGTQLRLIRSGDRDLILAGRDEQLLFARVVPAPAAPNELRATLARAASALGEASFETIQVVGIENDEREQLARTLDTNILDASSEASDPVGMGLAKEGRALIDLTPPEERVMRERRKTRKATMVMAAACGILVLISGVASMRKVSNLELERDDLQNQLAMLQIAKNELAQLDAEMKHEQANESVISQAYPGHRMSKLMELIVGATSQSMMVETIKAEDVEDVTRFTSAGEGATDKVTPRILNVRIHGLASSNLAVREFADKLLATKAFSNVRVEASERVLFGVGTEGERFRIHAKAETR